MFSVVRGGGHLGVLQFVAALAPAGERELSLADGRAYVPHPALCGAVAVILVGVLTSGSASADDIGLPAAFAAVLGLTCVGGLGVGIAWLRAVR